jgi:hypothetical protein
MKTGIRRANKRRSWIFKNVECRNLVARSVLIFSCSANFANDFRIISPRDLTFPKIEIVAENALIK